MASTVPVMRLTEYMREYQRDPEAKAADHKGNPAGPDTVGMLGRSLVRSKHLSRIGKEVDRLDQDEGVSLTPDRPVEYEHDELAADIDYLAKFPQEQVACDLGLTVRAWFNVAQGISHPRSRTAERIGRIAAEYRFRDRSDGVP
jgi:hypothetical protein